MQKGLILFAAASIVPTSGAWAADAARVPIEISASGEGVWYVRCEVEPAVGSAPYRELNKDHPSYRSDNLRSAACHYEANKKGLTIKITGAESACPFKGAAESDCTFSDKIGSGQFRFKR